MFDIGWSELLVIGVVALVVIGPKELPGVLRTLGQWVAKMRRMASDFQSQFSDAIREAELEDLRKQFDAAATAKEFGLEQFNPVESVRKELEGVMDGPSPAVKPETPPLPRAEPAAAPAVDPSPPVGTAPASGEASAPAKTTP